jgi:hypothetical protein
VRAVSKGLRTEPIPQLPPLGRGVEIGGGARGFWTEPIPQLPPSTTGVGPTCPKGSSPEPGAGKKPALFGERPAARARKIKMMSATSSPAAQRGPGAPSIVRLYAAHISGAGGGARGGGARMPRIAGVLAVMAALLVLIVWAGRALPAEGCSRDLVLPWAWAGVWAGAWFLTF